MKQAEAGKTLAATQVASPSQATADELARLLLDINESLMRQLAALLELIEAALTVNTPVDQALGAAAGVLREIVKTIEETLKQLASLQSQL